MLTLLLLLLLLGSLRRSPRLGLSLFFLLNMNIHFKQLQQILNTQPTHTSLGMGPLPPGKRACRNRRYTHHITSGRDQGGGNLGAFVELVLRTGFGSLVQVYYGHLHDHL